MNSEPENSPPSFCFRTWNGQRLTRRILDIGNEATESLRRGTQADGVTRGALAVLKLAVEGVNGKVTSEVNEDKARRAHLSRSYG